MPDSFAPEPTLAEEIWEEYEEHCTGKNQSDCAYFVSTVLSEYGLQIYRGENYLYWNPDCGLETWSNSAYLFKYLTEKLGFEAIPLPYDAFKDIVLPVGTPVFYNDGTYTPPRPQDFDNEQFYFNHAAVVVGQGRDSEGHIVPVVLDVDGAIPGKHNYNHTIADSPIIWVVLIGVYPEP
jgi:cell wall-associated NlpC family hydrolase